MYILGTSKYIIQIYVYIYIYIYYVSDCHVVSEDFGHFSAVRARSTKDLQGSDPSVVLCALFLAEVGRPIAWA